MSVPRRSRLFAGGGAAAAVLTSALLTPPAASASHSASGASQSVSRSMPEPVPALVPRGAVQRASAAVPAAVVRASTTRARTRLSLLVRPGRTLALVGVLSRYPQGQRVRGRWVDVYLRTADTGAWRLARQLRTSAGGRVEYDVRDIPLLQVTLRFPGDHTYRSAASATIVPDPTGARGLNPGLVAALARARAAAARAGLTLVVNSGFRTWARQQQMYDAAVRRYGSAPAARRWVLPPTESTHVRGLAVDLGTPAAAAWLAVRGARYGLCRVYADEAWHFEYRPAWVAAFGGRCPPPVTTPGDPDPLSPRPHVGVL